MDQFRILFETVNHFRMPEKSVFLGDRKNRLLFMTVGSLAWFTLILNPARRWTF